MKLVFLHGAPAVGKLTVAKALAELTSARLFDNHAAIDLARTIFDFGAPGFWELVGTARLAVIEAAAQERVPILIMTFCYSDPEDNPTIKKYESLLASHGSQILPVFLHCTVDEMCRRVVNEDRKTRKKISTESGLQSFLTETNLVPLPRSDCIKIDTEKYSAVQAATEIVKHFGLSQH